MTRIYMTTPPYLVAKGKGTVVQFRCCRCGCSLGAFPETSQVEALCDACATQALDVHPDWLQWREDTAA